MYMPISIDFRNRIQIANNDHLHKLLPRKVLSGDVTIKHVHSKSTATRQVSAVFKFTVIGITCMGCFKLYAVS